MSGSFDSLGNRMKDYENVTRNYLIKKMPVIIRLDGKSFHTFTKNSIFKSAVPKFPYSYVLKYAFMNTMNKIINEIQGARFAYTQSDEVSILLTDWKKINTEAWFNYNIQKICSVIASMFTANFNSVLSDFLILDDIDIPNVVPLALFDARVFNLPLHEVNNYFIWRQQDAVRNSINMLGQQYFSHKQLHGKTSSNVQEMLFQEYNVNWNDIDTRYKRGSCITSKYSEDDRLEFFLDYDIPIFTEDRTYIEKYLK